MKRMRRGDDGKGEDGGEKAPGLLLSRPTRSKICTIFVSDKVHQSIPYSRPELTPHKSKLVVYTLVCKFRGGTLDVFGLKM